MAKQPTVQLGQDLVIDGREGTFFLFCEGTKAGRYWAVQRRPGQPSLNVEVRRATKEDGLTQKWVECRD